VSYQDTRYRNPNYLAEWRAANPEKVAGQLERKRKRYHEDPEVMRERSRRNYAANRDERLAYQKAYNDLNRDAIRARLLERRFGLTVAELVALRERQGDACAICGTTGPLSIDHNHATGAVRGLLCATCNFMVGHGKDDPELLRKAAAYLEGSDATR
jgi:hypothetical protein